LPTTTNDGLRELRMLMRPKPWLGRPLAPNASGVHDLMGSTQ